MTTCSRQRSTLQLVEQATTVGRMKGSFASSIAKRAFQGGILIIFGKPGSSAFCCQCTPRLLARLPELLRHVADDIERDRGGI